MSTRHKLIATIPCGDPDLGVERECEITFTFLKGAPEQGPFYASGGQPADPDEIEFVSAVPFCNGKPSPFHGAYARDEQVQLDCLAHDWLESDEGYREAIAVACDDEDGARERAAEYRAEMQREDT